MMTGYWFMMQPDPVLQQMMSSSCNTQSRMMLLEAFWRCLHMTP